MNNNESRKRRADETTVTNHSSAPSTQPKRQNTNPNSILEDRMKCYYAVRKGRNYKNCIFFDHDDLEREIYGVHDAEFCTFFNIASAASYIHVSKSVRMSNAVQTPTAPITTNNSTAYSEYPAAYPLPWTIPTFNDGNNSYARFNNIHFQGNDPAICHLSSTTAPNRISNAEPHQWKLLPTSLNQNPSTTQSITHNKNHIAQENSTRNEKTSGSSSTTKDNKHNSKRDPVVINLLDNDTDNDEEEDEEQMRLDIADSDEEDLNDSNNQLATTNSTENDGNTPTNNDTTTNNTSSATTNSTTTSTKTTKRKRKKLPSKKIQQQRQSNWEPMYQKLVEHHQQHGSIKLHQANQKKRKRNVNENSTSQEDKELTKWLKEQRIAYFSFQRNQSISDENQLFFTVLTADRVEKLVALGVDLGPKRKTSEERTAAKAQLEETKWEDRFEILKQFKMDHGHCDPKISEMSDNVHRWMKDQRQEYKNVREGKESILTAQRIQRMNDLGFDWQKEVKRHKSFDERLAELKDFKEKFGHCIVPVSYPGGLGNWVRCERVKRKAMIKGDGSKCNMTQEQFQQLDDLGFTWEVFKMPAKEDQRQKKSWDEHFQDLLRFKEENGHTLVPQKYPGLGQWVHMVRVEYKYMKQGRKSRMTQEKALRLGEVGFVFEVRQRTTIPTSPSAPKLHASSLKLISELQPEESNMEDDIAESEES